MGGRGVRAVVAALLLGALGLGAGGWWAAQAETSVVARATVLVTPLEGNAFSPSREGTALVNLETEARLATSSSVAELVAELTGEPADTVLARVTAEVPSNTQLVEVSAEGATAAAATELAAAVAQSYLDFRRSRAESEVADRGARITEQIDSRNDERRSLVTVLERSRPGSPASLLAEQQVSEITTQVAQLRVQLAETQAASTDPGQVVVPAEPLPAGALASPLAPPLAGLVVGAGLGVLLGSVGALGGRRGLRLSGPGDLAPSGLPVLDRVPAAAGERARAVARVRAALLAEQEGSTLAVALCTPAPGSPAARAAARAFATSLTAAVVRTGRSAVQVALHGDGPQAQDAVGASLDLDHLLACGPGAVEVLHAAVGDSGAALVHSVREGDDLDDLSDSPALRALLLDAQLAADVVVLDAGSLTRAGARSVASGADVVVVALAEGETTVEQLEAAVEALEQVGRTPAGVVCLAPVRPPAPGRPGLLPRPARLRAAVRARARHLRGSGLLVPEVEG